MDVIIVGINHNNTLGLIWSLGEVGYDITLILYRESVNYVSKSRYISKCYLIDKDTEVIALIKKIASEKIEKPMVFVSRDEDANLLNEHYMELSSCCYFERGKSDGSINSYRDKAIGNQLAVKCGFTLPKNVVIDAPQDLNGLPFSFPILIKANNSIFGGKSAMRKCDTLNDAKSFANGLPSYYYPLQVQEFIEKEYEIMLLGCSLEGGKKVICPVANRKIRQYPKLVGLGSYSESIAVSHQPELEDLARKASKYLQEIEYTGLFSAEFLYSKKHYYFLEINLRNDGTSWLSTCSGYNLPDIVCQSISGKTFIGDDNFRPMNYMNIMADFEYVRAGELSFKQWSKLFKKTTCYSHYFRKDKLPFFYYMISTILSIIRIKLREYGKKAN